MPHRFGPRLYGQTFLETIDIGQKGRYAGITGGRFGLHGLGGDRAEGDRRGRRQRELQQSAKE